MKNHRQFFVSLSIAACTLILLNTGSLTADETLDLKVEFPVGRQFRIVADFEHSGTVIVDSEQVEQGKEKVNLLPLKVDAKLTYFQRLTGSHQAIRFYAKDSANIKLDQGKTQPSLDDSNRLIIARLKPDPGKIVEMASISDTLAQDELELLQHAADPLTLGRLLNQPQLKTGQQWAPETDDLAKFLGVQNIRRSDVKLQLKSFNAQSARIYVMGSVDADVDDVSTKLDVSGVIVVDRKENIVSSLKIGIQQIRELGQIAPGFEGNSKINLRITATDGTPELSIESLARITKNRKIQQRVKWKSNKSQFELIFEPHWKMIAEEQDAAILRFLKNTQIMAQVNVVLLPPRPANTPLKLEDYKKEVAKIVSADDQARLVDASQSITKSGLRKVCVVVASEEDELPINWVYYHVASNDGRQITFVFTLAESVFSQMNPSIERLVDEFVFNETPNQIASKKDAPRKTSGDQPQRSKKR